MQSISRSSTVLPLLASWLLDDSQQIGTAATGEPASTLYRSWPQTNDQRWVGNRIESPLRRGVGVRTSTTAVRPTPGGQEPLLDGSLLDGSLLDDELLDERPLDGGPLDDGSLDDD